MMLMLWGCEETHNKDESEAEILSEFHDESTIGNRERKNLLVEPLYSQQWHLAFNAILYQQYDIDNKAHIYLDSGLNKYSGLGVKIAIIDDGLDVNHEDLVDAIVRTYDIDSKDKGVAHNALNGQHGTAVTGIIGARANGKGILGIAYASEIIFLKHKENMSDSETIELFDKANEFGADIISNSWGTYDVSTAVKEKIRDLAINGRNGKGTIIVFAAGNSNQNMGNDESAIPEVIAVGSSDTRNLRAWYSNYGENLDILAPGGFEIGITTLDPMGRNAGVSTLDNDYLLFNDDDSFIATSASAPIVSGVIALMLEKNPELSREEIEEVLKASSDKIGSFHYDNGRNDYYGYGKINFNSIMLLMN